MQPTHTNNVIAILYIIHTKIFSRKQLYIFPNYLSAANAPLNGARHVFDATNNQQLNLGGDCAQTICFAKLSQSRKIFQRYLIRLCSVIIINNANEAKRVDHVSIQITQSIPICAVHSTRDPKIISIDMFVYISLRCSHDVQESRVKRWTWMGRLFKYLFETPFPNLNGQTFYISLAGRHDWVYTIRCAIAAQSVL